VYTGQILARADSGIESVEDLAGHSFCRPDELSTSGWIIPSIMMRANGVDPDADLTEIRDVGNHDAVVAAVYTGDCDAGSTFEDAREGALETYPDVMEQVVQVAVTDEIPNDNVAFAPTVPQEIRDQITEALITMTENEEDLTILNSVYEWEGLVLVDDTFYDAFRQTLQQSGVDVNTFISE
jgi:phosphonate transport system substrate-binding protein